MISNILRGFKKLLGIPVIVVALFRDVSFLKALGVSTVCWIALAATFPPYKLFSLDFPFAFQGVLSFVLLAPFFVVIKGRPYREVALISFIGGFVHNVCMFYWLSYVMDSGQDVSVVVGIGMVLLMSYLALYVTFLGLSFKFLYNRSLLMLYPIIWVGIELVKTKGEISLPWGHIGYTLGGSQTLMQGLAYIGIFGYSALIVISNLYWFRAWTERKYRYIGYGLAPIVVMAIVGFVILSGRSDSLDTADIVVAQPSIEQREKWIRKDFDKVIDQTLTTADLINSDSADLIIFPETAIPEYLRKVSRLSERIQKLAYDKHSSILIGALDYQRSIKGSIRKYKVYNSGFLFSKDSTVARRKYDKNRLVPFSERLPWEDIIPAIQHLNMGEGDFTAGTESPAWDAIKFSPQICYEVVYPYFIRNAISEGAKIIVVITNDAWFKRSTQPYQHANLIRFRAIENGIPIVQSANTGISVLYDSYGTELDRAELFERKAMRHKVPLKNRTTLYSLIGDGVENIFFALFLIILLWQCYEFVREMKKKVR
ncbi:MAG: apolipoprotein N-acyltransferase [Fibrobacterales bacterium]